MFRVNLRSFVGGICGEVMMQVRFECPACHGTHVFDMPETTIHMTCAQTGQVLELRLTAGGDVKSAVVGGSGEKAAAVAG